MRTDKKRTSDFSVVSRRSINRDFVGYRKYVREKKGENSGILQNLRERRIAFVGEKSDYYQFRALLVGRMVRILERASVGGWQVEFMYDNDRKALNRAAGWSDKKKVYLINNIKFD